MLSLPFRTTTIATVRPVPGFTNAWILKAVPRLFPVLFPKRPDCRNNPNDVFKNLVGPEPLGCYIYFLQPNPTHVWHNLDEGINLDLLWHVGHDQPKLSKLLKSPPGNIVVCRQEFKGSGAPVQRFALSFMADQMLRMSSALDYLSNETNLAIEKALKAPNA